jgi:hypothetical protein
MERDLDLLNIHLLFEIITEQTHCRYQAANITHPNKDIKSHIDIHSIGELNAYACAAIITTPEVYIGTNQRSDSVGGTCTNTPIIFGISSSFDTSAYTNSIEGKPTKAHTLFERRISKRLCQDCIRLQPTRPHAAAIGPSRSAQS